MVMYVKPLRWAASTWRRSWSRCCRGGTDAGTSPRRMPTCISSAARGRRFERPVDVAGVQKLHEALLTALGADAAQAQPRPGDVVPHAAAAVDAHGPRAQPARDADRLVGRSPDDGVEPVE